MQATLNKEQILKIVLENFVCQDTIDTYKIFNGTHKEFAELYPYYTLDLCRLIPNFVDEETFLHCCKKFHTYALWYHAKELRKNHFDLFKELCLKDPNVALEFHSYILRKNHLELYEQLLAVVNK